MASEIFKPDNQPFILIVFFFPSAVQQQDSIHISSRRYAWESLFQLLSASSQCHNQFSIFVEAFNSFTQLSRKVALCLFVNVPSNFQANPWRENLPEQVKGKGDTLSPIRYCDRIRVGTQRAIFKHSFQRHLSTYSTLWNFTLKEGMDFYCLKHLEVSKLSANLHTLLLLDQILMLSAYVQLVYRSHESNMIVLFFLIINAV